MVLHSAIRVTIRGNLWVNLRVNIRVNIRANIRVNIRVNMAPGQQILYFKPHILGRNGVGYRWGVTYRIPLIFSAAGARWFALSRRTADTAGEKSYKQPHTMNMDGYYCRREYIVCVEKLISYNVCSEEGYRHMAYDCGMFMRRHGCYGHWTAGLSVSSSPPTGLTPSLSP